MNDYNDTLALKDLQPDYSLPSDPDQGMREVRLGIEDCARRLESIEQDASRAAELMESIKTDVETMRYAIPVKLSAASGTAWLPLWLIVGLLAWIAFFK